MSAMVELLAGLLSALLLALDAQRRTGQIAYYRIIITVALASLAAVLAAGALQPRPGTGAGVVVFLAIYIGILALLWFSIVRPKDPLHALLRQGISLLHTDYPQQALIAFNQALDHAKSRRIKGWILVYMAACELRLRDKDLAVKTLAEALRVLPSVVARIAKEKDLAELYSEARPGETVASGEKMSPQAATTSG